MGWRAFRSTGSLLRHLIAPACEPFGFVRGVLEYPRYLVNWARYSSLAGAERPRIADALPKLHDRTRSLAVDPHYFYANGWAMRGIVQRSPKHHVDVGSQSMFANLLGAVVPVTFLEYRPLELKVEGVTNRQGDLLDLPFPDGSLESVSCLHVAEHLGLGRYGDDLNPEGTRRACSQLARVLAKGGLLYFAVPVGVERVCFNAHRVLAPETVMKYFADLELKELSGVDDNGRFLRHVSPQTLADNDYACGMFLFQKS